MPTRRIPLFSHGEGRIGAEVHENLLKFRGGSNDGVFCSPHTQFDLDGGKDRRPQKLDRLFFDRLGQPDAGRRDVVEAMGDTTGQGAGGLYLVSTVEFFFI
jgi:hypothetical protein